jgi:hypothetical protein
MKSFKISSQAILVLYRFLLPACALILLLIVSQNTKRTLFLGSQGWDLFARIWILFMFCLLYVRLSDLERYMSKTYGMKIDHSKDNESPLSKRNIFWGILLGVVSLPLTWWTIQVFLPFLSEVSWLLALFHGFLISIPMAIWRNELVL